MWWQQKPTATTRYSGNAGTVGGANLADSPTSIGRGGGGAPGVGQKTKPANVVNAVPQHPAESLGSTGAVLPASGSPPAAPPFAKTPKIMPLEPLISQAGKQALIARDGTPLRIELSPGNPASAVELKAWTDDRTRNADGHYNWRFQIKVAEGELVERMDATDFEAPETGYALDFAYAMDQSLPKDQWKNTLSKSFFVHLHNDTYGLLNVQLVAGGAHFVTVKAYLNPAIGSRNLQPPPPPPVKHR